MNNHAIETKDLGRIYKIPDHASRPDLGLGACCHPRRDPTPEPGSTAHQHGLGREGRLTESRGSFTPVIEHGTSIKWLGSAVLTDLFLAFAI